MHDNLTPEEQNFYDEWVANTPSDDARYERNPWHFSIAEVVHVLEAMAPYVCKECGAQVDHVGLHDAWHERLAGVVQSKRDWLAEREREAFTEWASRLTGPFVLTGKGKYHRPDCGAAKNAKQSTMVEALPEGTVLADLHVCLKS